MKIIISILIFSLYLISPFKGYRGSYYIIGIAYIDDTKPLRNKIFRVEFGRNIEKIKTNQKGEFVVKIDFEFPCQSGISPERSSKENIERFTNSFNPRYIFFDFKGKCIELENYFYNSKGKDLTSEKFKHDLRF